MPDIDTKTLAKFTKNMIELEIDLLTCSRTSICLTEVKSNPSLGFKAWEQLEKAEIIIKILLIIIGLGEKNIAIKKLVAVPPPIPIQLKQKKINVFEIDSVSDNERTIDEFHPNSAKDTMTEEELNTLVASLIFMKCSHYYPKIEQTKGNLQFKFGNCIFTVLILVFKLVIYQKTVLIYIKQL